MNILWTPDKQRAEYSRLELMLKEVNPGVDFIINQYVLTLEAVLDAAKSSYIFDLRENPQDRPLEEKLNLNDLFYTTALGMAVRKYDPVAGNYANYPMYTYPDQLAFPGVVGTDTEAFALSVLWSSTLTIRTQPVNRLENFPTFLLKNAPKQPATATYQGEYGSDMKGQGFVGINPGIIIDGYDTNQIELRLGTGDRTLIAGGVTAAGAAIDTRNVVVLNLYGYKVINGAQKLGAYTAI